MSALTSGLTEDSWILLFASEFSVSYISIHIIYVVVLSHVQLCDPMDCSTPGFPVLHFLLEFAQTYVHWINDAIQPSHPLRSLC